MIRRKRLYVRQSFAYLQGKSNDSSYSVGYWEKKFPFNPCDFDPDRYFRSFGSRPTEAEAVAFASEIAQQKKHSYIF